MGEISPADAGLSGLRLARRNPGIVLAWGVALILVSFVTSAVTILVAGPALTALSAAGSNPDPEASLRWLGVLGPFYLGLLVFMALYYGVALGAVNRAVLRPEDRRSAYLRFGADELRLIVLMIVQMILGGLAAVAALLPLFVLVGVGAGTQNPAVSVIGAVVGVLFAAAAMIFLGIRFSLAASQTFATRRINVFGSWSLTRGRFWPLVGAYLLAVVVYLVVYLLFVALMSIVALAVGGGFAGVTSIFNPDMTSLQAFFSPVMILYTIAGGLVSALGMMILYSPAAAIYRDIAQPTTADVFA